MSETPASPSKLPPSIAERFPLVPRPRPPAGGLQERLAEIDRLAHTPAPTSPAIPAAEALNKAALLASDLGHSHLATRLCYQQFHAFNHAGPLPPSLATAAMQPLVNLGRLAIRARDTTRAYTIFEGVYNATRTRTALILDGIDIDTAKLFDSDESARTAGRFLWTVLIGDGTRALTRAGRWDDALTHLHRHRGIGQRLLDGRQTLILARHLAGDTKDALATLTQTDITQPWERAIAATLHVLCLHADDMAPGDTLASAIDTYEAFDCDPAHRLFRTRLGLVLLELAHREADSARLATGLIDDIASGKDGHTATEALSHPKLKPHLNETKITALSRTAATAATRKPTLSVAILEELSATADTATRALSDYIAEIIARPCLTTVLDGR
ncbi:conserved hypothetical protein [Frankia sp. AiPs1]|uniref:hypothetical protein n=1 Tax=Frankia sp. AiPa1 TaxID=573492 RepID=UPI00202B58FA|nr:hypothetical protein [Frankia sp. AiPa1]MCL9760404.1 hypothetical protein [Frankia sp. AiPa1]